MARAALLHSIGGTLALGQIDDPIAGDGEVVVDVAYASVNPLDIWITQGTVGAAAANLPWIPGTEATGFVDGQPVLVRGGTLGIASRGAYASKVAVPTAWVTALDTADHLAEVAALGVAGVTAHSALHLKAGVTAADTVLVLGASGGVGSIAVQLAKLAGATVWAQTSSTAKADSLRYADRVIVAEADQLLTALDGAAPTVVLDGLGGGYTGAAVDALAAGGRLVNYGTSAAQPVAFNMRTFYRKGLTLSGYAGLLVSTEAQAATLASLIAAVQSGELTVDVELVPLAAAAAAHARILARDVRGKLVLDCR